MSEGHSPDKKLPDFQKEVRRYTNRHLTELGSSFSVGFTDVEPGFYPANDETGEAQFTVAPDDFVQKYVKEHNDGEETDQAIFDAIKAYERQNKAE